MSEYPLRLAFPLGGSGYIAPEDLRSLDGTNLEWVEDHCEDGKQLLLWQFQGKPRLEAVLCALLRSGVQDLHDGAWQVLTEVWLDTAVGVNLDRIGWLVDYQRQSWSDSVYRQLLSAQIRVLRSRGEWRDLIGIMQIIGFDASLTDVADLPPAAGRMILGEPFDGAISEVEAFDLMNRARTGGVRFDLEYPESAVADAFTWADGDTEQVDASRGWAPDDESSGGYWAGVRSTEET